MHDPLEPLRAHQGDRCAICEEVKTLLVDHDHATGFVRGLLCIRCNTSEGKSDYPWLRAYRADPPAAAIGLQVLYGEHLPKNPAPPRKGGRGPLTTFRHWAAQASDRPDWLPTMPDDQAEAELLEEFWSVLRALGAAEKVWVAEDAEAAR